ncbi:MAG: diadenylate cyclase CdaA [Candidatus Omnitrophota bacterium]
MLESLIIAYNVTKPILEIVILWIAFYHILVFFAGTRSFQVLRGITYIAVIFLVSMILKLETLNWILTKLFGLSIIAFLIIFQQEIRQGLARLGRQHLFNITLEEAELTALIDEITSAAYKMSKKRIGCLIAIEREAKLQTYIESGVHIDSRVSAELIQSVFTPPSPLHDGGMIIRGDRIIAASCLFPLSDNPNFSKIIGTRHRAALGLTEQTDAIVIMVSEETGEISVAEEGRFIPVINRERLVNILKNIVMTEKPTKAA